MKINKYPDGASYVNGIGMGLHSSVFKINSYEDLWHLNQAIDAYYNYFGTKPTITIPNLIDAQADRRFNNDESSGLKLVCEFLNSMKANFKIFHPHNPEVVEALMDNVEIIDNSEFIKQVVYNELYPGPGFPNPDMYNNLILMSSDAGGFKPLMKLCDKLNWQGETYSASISRSYVDGKSVLTQLIDIQNFEGKDILIIDDICVYGGTFKGLSKLLRERNCGKLYLAVSHMTVQNLGNNPITKYFDKVFTTNSKYDFYEHPLSILEYKDLITPKNLEIIKMF